MSDSLNDTLSEVIPIAPSPDVPDVFEWLRRGDGTLVLYKNGQISGDQDEIAAHLAERPV
jgi:hypothetical protein